jgi:hypothetical protein
MGAEDKVMPQQCYTFDRDEGFGNMAQQRTREERPQRENFGSGMQQASRPDSDRDQWI